MGTFAVGTLNKFYSPRDIQSFTNVIGPVYIQEARFMVLVAVPWNWSKALSLLAAIPEVEDGPR